MGHGVVYRYTFYRSGDIRIAAKAYLEALPSDVTKLVSGGSSGCAIASAMLTLTDRKLTHMHIYDPQAIRHRDRFGDDSGYRPTSDRRDVLCFVDDFMESGSTARSVSTHGEVKNYGHLKYLMVDRPYGAIEPCEATAADIGAELIWVDCDIV